MMAGARKKPSVVLIAGGVGGAKMAAGFDACDDVDLSVIGNIADDAWFHGLYVSPDIDTLTYTLSGRVDTTQGWGLAGDSHNALAMLERLGSPTWMRLGDADFGVHIYRTQRLARGERPCDIATDIARALGVRAHVILPSDDEIRTFLRVDEGWIAFQDYFVRLRHAPQIYEIAYRGLDAARPTGEALAAIKAADLIVIAPSNPLASIRPIIGIDGIAPALARARARVFAVSPLIGGKVVRGPADRMMRACGLRADVEGIARLYREFLDVMVVDHTDALPAGGAHTDTGLEWSTAPVMMHSLADKKRLAGILLEQAGLRGARGAVQ